MQEQSIPRDRVTKDSGDRDRAEQIAALQRLLAQARESGVSAQSMEAHLYGRDPRAAATEQQTATP